MAFLEFLLSGVRISRFIFCGFSQKLATYKATTCQRLFSHVLLGGSYMVKINLKARRLSGQGLKKYRN